jgi:Zn finger protein HypA/HybF involved in hydrogenase expression
MFVFNFRNLVMIATVRRSLAALCLAALGAAGCNQLLLQSTPASGNPDGGDAAVVALVTRDTHTPWFPIADGTTHAAQVCSDCHAQDAGSFTDYTCVSCHDHSADVAAGRHTYITGFVFQSSACFSCHPTGNEAPINVEEHSNKYFTINDSAHGGLQCSDCHQDPTTSKPFTCISCHDHNEQGEAMNHMNVSGYSYDSNSCFSCHKVTTAPTDASTN